MFNPSHFHPMLVHFPIALVIIGFLAELASLVFKKETCLSKTGFYLLITGTLSAIVTWLSGILFTTDMSGAAGSVKEIHETLAIVSVSLLIITSVIRVLIQTGKEKRPLLKKTALVFYALACISIMITGFYGGTLVYNYMMPL